MSRSIASVLSGWAFPVVSTVVADVLGDIQPASPRKRKRNRAPQIKATFADCLAKSNPGAGGKRAKRRQKGNRHANV